MRYNKQYSAPEELITLLRERGLIIEQEEAALRNIRSIGAATSSDTTSEITQTGDLSIGCRVLHDKFGQGRVVAIKNSTAGLKVSVEFDQVGCKDLLTKFAKLKVIG